MNFSSSKNSLFWASIFIFTSSLAIFSFSISFTSSPYFDEMHYIPAARKLLLGMNPQNLEHPPLAKYLIALGMKIFGDNPVGWRSMSALFGSFTLVGLFLWAFALFRKIQFALLATILGLANHLLYVQARIAMLEVFVVAFIIWGLWAFTEGFNEEYACRSRKNFFRLAGVFLGFAIACKWFGIIPWMTCIAILILIKFFKQLRIYRMSKDLSQIESDDRSFPPLYTPRTLQGISLAEIGFAWILIPCVIYFSHYIPFYFLKGGFQGKGIAYIFKHPLEMLQLQKSVGGTHPYQSEAWQWLLPIRPIWYYFNKVKGSSNLAQGVILLGNPALLISGLASLGFCLWGFLERFSRSGLLIVLFYLTFYFCWVLIPRKISFYYYYYPAAMVLSLAPVFAFYYFEYFSEHFPKWIKWAFASIVVATFLYFLPILSGMKMNANSYNYWMWLKTWI